MTDSLNLESVGVLLDKDNRKIIGNHDNDQERSSVPHIYGLGDVLQVLVIKESEHLNFMKLWSYIIHCIF